MSSIKFLFLNFFLLAFAQPQLHAQHSRPNCAGKDKREPICDVAECNQLMVAAENGDLIRVRALLKEEVDVNVRSKSGFTALMLAANAGHLQVVKALLRAGADVNVRTYSFHSGEYIILMSAMNRCNKDWLEILDAMISAGAEVNPKEVFSNSPLMFAITRYDPILVKTLIERGADVNLKNERGTTPLMTAVMSRGSTIEIVKLLLAAGADINAHNNDGETALSMVQVYVTEKNERAELSRLLRKHP